MSEDEFKPTFKNWGEISSSIDSALEPTVKAKVVAVLKDVLPKGKDPDRGVSGRKCWTDKQKKAFRNRLGSTAHWIKYRDVRDQLRQNHPEWNKWEFSVVAAEQFTPANIAKYEHENEKPTAAVVRRTRNSDGLPCLTVFKTEELSPREVLLWVSTRMGAEMPEAKDCPNVECYGALLNARDKPSDFWKSFYSLVRKDDSDANDPLADDGRKNLAFVDRQIEQFAKDNPELVGKKHMDFTDTMWKEAGQIVSGGTG